MLSASPWQNPAEALDVNDDGHVLPEDALLIANLYNEQGPGPLGEPSDPVTYYDVDGDGSLSTNDFDLVAAYLNANGMTAPTGPTGWTGSTGTTGSMAPVACIVPG